MNGLFLFMASEKIYFYLVVLLYYKHSFMESKYFLILYVLL